MKTETWRVENHKWFWDCFHADCFFFLTLAQCAAVSFSVWFWFMEQISLSQTDSVLFPPFSLFSLMSLAFTMGLLAFKIASLWKHPKKPFPWYRGDFGRLGHGNSSDVFTPQLVKALHGLQIKQIACGDSHCLAVTMEGEVQRLIVLSLSILIDFLLVEILEMLSPPKTWK